MSLSHGCAAEHQKRQGSVAKTSVGVEARATSAGSTSSPGNGSDGEHFSQTKPEELEGKRQKASDKKPTKRGKGTKGAKSGANKKSQTARRKNQSPRMVEWDPGGVIAGASGQIVHGKY